LAGECPGLRPGFFPLLKVMYITFVPSAGDLCRGFERLFDPLVTCDEAEREDERPIREAKGLVTCDEAEREDERPIREAKGPLVLFLGAVGHVRCPVMDELDLSPGNVVDPVQEFHTSPGHHHNPRRAPCYLVHKPPLGRGDLLLGRVKGGDHRSMEVLEELEYQFAIRAAVDPERVLQRDDVGLLVQEGGCLAVVLRHPLAQPERHLGPECIAPL